MSSLKKSSTRRSDDTMDDDSDDKDSKRKSRNLSEKKRRDQFNLLVNELSLMVSTGSRKMDKSTVLKSTISFLKHHNEVTVQSKVNEIHKDWKPTFLSNEEFTHLVLEAVDGFIIVFSAAGQIFYTSETITSLLGHLPDDLLNMTIFELASNEEHNNLYNILLAPSEDQGELSFTCHLRRGGSDNNKPNSYELVHFVGYFRSDEDFDTKYSGYSTENDHKLVFVGTGRIQTPQLIRELPLIDSMSKTEFTSRHSLEWKFLFLDHRAPPIIGYLPFELLGTSGYDYYHIDDLENVTTCHEALMKKGEGTSCYYRFLTKGQQWIWLQTRFFITYHQWNSKPEFIVCTHRVISYIDVMKQRSKDGSKSTIEVIVSSGEAPVRSSHWNLKSKSNIRHRTASDCTSISVDSPTSGATMNQPSQQQLMHQQSEPLQQNNQFIEPLHYVTAIPVQPMISTFPSTVLSPLQPMDNVIISPTQHNHNQMQMDLQRKQFELQAIIGQQQAELRRVSEQLLMTRLGLLSDSQSQAVQNVPVLYECSSSGIVSSTTTMQRPQGNGSSILMPLGVSMPTLEQQGPTQNQLNIMFTSPDSNEQSN